MKSILKVIFLALILNACSVPEVQSNDSLEQSNDSEELAVNIIAIPDGFDYSTNQEVKVTIKDNSNYVRYDVFAYSDELYFAGDGNFISNNGFPWAIDIVHDFKVPKEKIAINKAYNHFNTWAISGGIQYKDWYKDSAGFRNTENIQD